MNTRYGAERDDTIPRTIGHATIAWNNLCHAIFQTFEALTRLDLESAKAVFFVVKSDRAQRDMVSELINSKLKAKNQTLADKFQTAIGEANKLAGKRNDIVHVVFIEALDTSKIALFRDVGFLKGKKGRDLVSTIENMTTETLALAVSISDFKFRNSQDYSPDPRNRRSTLAWYSSTNIGRIFQFGGIRSPKCSCQYATPSSSRE